MMGEEREGKQQQTYQRVRGAERTKRNLNARRKDYKVLKYFRNVKRILKIIVLPVRCILRTSSVDSRRKRRWRRMMKPSDLIYYDAH